MDFAAEGLLDGLEGEERTAREQLLSSLIEQGFDLEQLKGAAAEDRLALLPVERVLAGQHSAEEIERMTGLPADALMRIRRSLGLPEGDLDEKLFCEADVEAARSIRTFMEAGFDEARMTDITRVLGEGMARLSAASAAATLETFLKPGDSEHDVAWRFAELAEKLTVAFEPVLVAGFRAHLLDNVRRAVLSRAELASGQVVGEQEVAVCFADLVGFTRLGAELGTHELGDVVGAFGELASQVAEPPVRLVKTIGDAALLVSRDCGPLVIAALRLLEQVDAADLPALRAGVAWGPAIPRAGDFYGHAVNLASRVTAVARPGTVLCTREVRDGADGFEWSSAGRFRLKGVGDSLPLYRARPVPAAEIPEDHQPEDHRPEDHRPQERQPEERADPEPASKREAKRPRAGRRRR